MGTTLQEHLKASSLELGGSGTTTTVGAWRYTLDTENIGWLLLNCPEAQVNTISQAVLQDLEELLAHIATDVPRAVILRSAKQSGFAAGADIHELAKLDPETLEQLLGDAHTVLHELEGLPCPTIAVVHGAALGAGMELALACDYRIAVDGASFGLPEVQLGLHPGLGGTVRLPQLIDPTEALQMMLTGKTTHTKRAKKLGIVDLVVEERHVRAAVTAITHGDVEKQSRGWMSKAFALSAARSVAAEKIRREVAEKAPEEHYPAPYALIRNWSDHGNDPQSMQDAEIASFTNLLKSDTCKALIRAFKLRQTLKSKAGKPCSIQHVHVVGAGIMGAEIAAWSAMHGKRVSVSDADDTALGDMVKRAAGIFKDAHLDSLAQRDAMDRLMPDPLGYGLGKADLVIEAGPEDRAKKKQIFADIGPKLKVGAILASNTSSLQLDDLARNAPARTRFAGLHFFNPVSKVPLIEVVSQSSTSAETRARLMSFCTAIRRLPVAVSDAPGFVVNRALMPYLLEALILMDEGVPKERIDRTALDFGMPMGPVTLADQVGLDICLDVAESLNASLDTPIAEISALLRDKVTSGNLGRKTGKGFYDWSDGTPVPNAGAQHSEDLTDRLLLPMINACAECLRKGLVSTQAELDAAIIFGTGFAPFRGGPMHYAQTRGFQSIHDQLATLEKAHGPRFAPDPYWAKPA